MFELSTAAGPSLAGWDWQIQRVFPGVPPAVSQSMPTHTGPHSTYRDLLAHPDLAEVGLHPSSHLPDYCLRWLRLEGPFPGVQLVPDGAVGRHRELETERPAGIRDGAVSGHCTHIQHLSLLQNHLIQEMLRPR